MDQRNIRLGTSAFTAAGWEGSFYPEGMKPADYLSYYAKHFNSVELDNTFYRAPSKTTVEGWARKTPEGFVFAAKVPQVITHEKVLVDCDVEFQQFVETMELLGKKLGPLLFQFGYFNKNAFAGLKDFLARLRPFLKKLAKDHQFAVEIRNKNWLVPQFAVRAARGWRCAGLDRPIVDAPARAMVREVRPDYRALRVRSLAWRPQRNRSTDKSLGQVDR
jgi:uncharacterized protein YecE (DUF72 family)